MECYTEFSIPHAGEHESVDKYFQIEEEFMALENYFKDYGKGQIRKNALLLIQKLYTRGRGYFDAFTPYLAMNYFDRYVSRHSLPNSAWTPYKNVYVLGICCFTIAAKMTTKSFSVVKFRTDQNLSIAHKQILETELTVLDGLEWRMRSVTAFCFLDYYYPRFSSLGFTLRSISEIIIQFTSMNTSTRFLPSVIALSSLLAATQIEAPAKYEELRPKGEVTPHLADLCLAELIDMCKKKKISIETVGTDFAASTSTSTITPLAGGVASEEATPTDTVPIPSRRPGKEVLISDERDSDEIVSAEEDKPIVSAAEDKPKKPLDFALLWEEDVWDIYIPPLVGQDTGDDRDIFIAPLVGQDTAAAASEHRTSDTDSFNRRCLCECCNIM